MTSSCCDIHKHPDHSSETAKLNRVSGQIEGVRKMIAERRYCPDILIQLRAARSALKTIEANILEAHLSSCLLDAMNNGDAAAKEAKVLELKEIFKRYED